MSRATRLWDENPDRGADGSLHVDGPAGAITIGTVVDGPGEMLHIWTGHESGPAPLRIHDPTDGDDLGATAAALFGGAVEEGR